MPRSKRRKKERRRPGTSVDRPHSNHPVPANDTAQHPKERRAMRAQHMQVEQTLELYQGALPHPDHLERFEALLPGATDRFLGLAERQSAHRQRMEKKFLNFNGATQILGSLFAGVIVLA